MPRSPCISSLLQQAFPRQTSPPRPPPPLNLLALCGAASLSKNFSSALYFQALCVCPSSFQGRLMLYSVSSSWCCIRHLVGGQIYICVIICISSFQLLSCVRLFVTPCTVACQASLSITNSQSLLKLMSIESVMQSNHLILCRPLLLRPSVFPSIRVFSSESVLCIRWPKYWSFSFNIGPSNEYSGLISFRMDWLDLLAVQGTLQHHSSKASVLRCSAFFIVKLSHPYTTAGKTIALPRQTFVGQVMSLLFNKLSRLIITFLPRSKCLLISWMQSPCAVILEPPKIKSATVSSSICHEVTGPDAMILVFWMLSFKPTFSLSSFY